MSEHTLGPWRVNGHIVEGDTGKGGKQTLVAQVCTHDTDRRLISAAPDLLAACEAVVEQLSAHPTLDMTIQCGSDPFAVRICREAIAKATGHPPGDPP